MRRSIPLFALACGRSSATPAPTTRTPSEVAETVQPVCETEGQWTPWAPGLDVGVFRPEVPTPVGDGLLRIVRADPAHWRTEAHTTDRPKVSRTADQWADVLGAAAVINAGMFATDMTTHVGSLTVDGKERGQPTDKYQSVAVFEPTATHRPAFDLVDTDRSGRVVPTDYRFTVQNLRLIRAPGDNRWGNRSKLWSVAALAKDAKGRMWWVFTRSPWSMPDLNDTLIALGATAAQHLEGGPEAQLLVAAGGCRFFGFGRYETGFVEHDGNDFAWAVPNVLALFPRQ